MIPKKLLEIKDFLLKTPIKLSKRFEDGRTNASINENEIIEIINKEFDIKVPPPRFWYDFLIVEGNEKIPVNIKVTSTETADNLQCKMGIYYALTGLWPDFANETPWKEYFSILKRDLSKNKDKDYYFLIINKNNSKDIFCNSLKQLETLVPNGNNLPFQCKWGTNRIPKTRTHDESVEFILGKLRESIALRANILRDFEEIFNKSS